MAGRGGGNRKRDYFRSLEGSKQAKWIFDPDEVAELMAISEAERRWMECEEDEAREAARMEEEDKAYGNVTHYKRKG